MRGVFIFLYFFLKTRAFILFLGFLGFIATYILLEVSSVFFSFLWLAFYLAYYPILGVLVDLNGAC